MDPIQGVIDFSRFGSLRVFHDEPRSGQENMRIDEQLLAEAKPSSPVSLRIYRWCEPTLSLGHFQSIDQLTLDPSTVLFPALRTLPWVRRKTGGGAILHDRELTYSLVIPSPRNRSWKGHDDRLYRAIHGSIRDGLIALGYQATLSADCTCEPGKTNGSEPFLCFERRSPVDVVIGPHKVLGSAQRRTRSGLLQHGSLLLDACPAYPRLGGLAQLAPPDASRPTWAEWLEAQILAGATAVSGSDC